MLSLSPKLQLPNFDKEFGIDDKVMGVGIGVILLHDGKPLN